MAGLTVYRSKPAHRRLESRQRWRVRRLRLGLLLGKVGFVLFNLPLWLALVGFVVLMRRSIAERPELISAGAWAIGTWLAYAALSTNYSGGALSIRWFVPLLATGFYVLSVFLRDHRSTALTSLSVSDQEMKAGPFVEHLEPLKDNIAR